MTPDDYLNAAIVIQVNKRRRAEQHGDYELTDDVMQHIKGILTKRSLKLDDTQIKSCWECLSHI